MIYGEWFFPVYLPYLLVLVKWVGLLLAHRDIVPGGFVDISFAMFTFDLWALTRKAQGEALRPGTTITSIQNRREGTCVVADLLPD